MIEGNKEEIVDEAILRLHQLGFKGNVIDAYKKNSKVFISEYGKSFPVENPAFLSLLKMFEDTYGCTIYHVIHSITIDGSHYYGLTISNNSKKWLNETQELEKNTSELIEIKLDINEIENTSFKNMLIHRLNDGLICFEYPKYIKENQLLC